MAKSPLPSQFFQCFPRVMELYAEEAGIDLNAHVPRSADGVLRQDEGAQAVRKKAFNFRVEQFTIFINVLFESGPSSSNPATTPWLPKYLRKKCPSGTTVDLEGCVKLLKPLLIAFAAVLKLDELEEVAGRFAKLSLARAEYLLDHPDKLRAALKKLDDVLVVDSMMSQERHPEADTSTDMSANETGANEDGANETGIED